MAEKSADMLHRAMTSNAGNDLQTAKIVALEEDIGDECYTKLYYEAVDTVLLDAENLERGNYVIRPEHKLEHLRDRVTNICERVIYILTGVRPKGSLTTGRLWLPSNESW